MSNKRKIEIFSAGCPACDEAIQMVERIACPSCETEVLDMSQPEVAARAKQLGISAFRGSWSTASLLNAVQQAELMNRCCARSV